MVENMWHLSACHYYYSGDLKVPEFVMFSDRVIYHISVCMVGSLSNLFQRPSSLEKLDLLSIGAKTRDALQNTLKSVRQLMSLTSLTLGRIMLDDGLETTLSDWEIVFGPSRVHQHVWKYDCAWSDLNDCIPSDSGDQQLQTDKHEV
jgi:hypothetical protein